MNKKIKIMMLSAIFIGGFASLATELIALRQLSTFVGSTTAITSIIIGVIMLFMSVGYYKGSSASLLQTRLRNTIYKSFIRLSWLVILSSSFVLLAAYFTGLYMMEINNSLLKTTIYSLIFLSYPSYVFGLITSLASRLLHKYNRNYTGKVMAVDTIGSVLGSLVSTLVFMPLLGVNYTIVCVVIMCLFGAALFSKRFLPFRWCAILLTAIILNHGLILEKIFGIVENNAVSTIAILNIDKGKSKLMTINDTFASKLSADKNLLFEYTVYIDENFINTLPKDKKSKILILGAGGFTMGKDDDFNDYTYVDIDKSLKKHAEEKFLGKKLGANKKFVVNDANQFLNENKEKYDLIVLDSYSAETPPLSLVTAEYFQRVKNHVKEGGIVAMNIAAQPDFSDNYSTHIDNTLRAIFTHNLHSQVLKNYNPWISDKEEVNILYTWFNRPNSGEIYTNNKNRLSLDR